MKIAISIKILVISIFLINSNPLVAQEKAKEIFTKATQMLTAENFEITMAIDATDGKGRLKSKELTVLLAKFGDEEKTKVTWQKPERAKGTIILITDVPNQTGIIEVYTPSNGKTRKLKATDENKNKMGAEFSITSFAKYNPDELSYELLSDTIINENDCFRIKVFGNDAEELSSAVLVINKSTYLILQVAVFNEKNMAISLTQLYDYKNVNGAMNKMYPMRIETKDYKNKKDIAIRIIDISTKNDLKQSDFAL
jgi:hypothetical protein